MEACMARYLVDGQVSIDMSLEYLIKWAINEAAIYNVYGTTNMLIRYFNSWLRCGVMYIIFAHTFLEQNLMLYHHFSSKRIDSLN